MKRRIWLSPPHMGGDELRFIEEAFHSNWIAPVGANIRHFEEDICRYTGAKHAVALSSGTAALHLALILLGVGPGDEVLCSTFTFSATVNPVLYLGATPILVDSGISTWNICVKETRRAIEDRLRLGKKPKALIVVHLYGQAAKIEELVQLSLAYDIPVIEDAAEALGATYQGRMLGTFGAMGVFSFNGNKIITTSGGGALISDNGAWIEKARYLSTQARDPAPHFQHSEVGYNYALSNVLAGIGRGQMQVLEDRIARRRAIFEYYRRAFADIPAISFSPELPGSRGNRWLTCLLIDEQLAGGVGPETLRLALEAEEIESRLLWKPMHQQPVFAQYPYYGTRHIADDLFRRGLCLPSGSNLSADELERIVAVVRSVFGK